MKQNIVRISPILFIIASVTIFMMGSTLEEVDAWTYHECYKIVWHPISFPPYVWPELVRYEVRHGHLNPHIWSACTSS